MRVSASPVALGAAAPVGLAVRKEADWPVRGDSAWS
jgi:hypothetical protein